MAVATYEVWADWFQFHEEGKELINVSITKALAATGNYIIGDVLSENESTGTAWTFSDAVKQNGCSGEITKAQAICETTSLAPRLTLYLFTTVPTSQLNDNAPNTALLHADLASYIGKIDFPPMEDLGGDSETIATPSTYGNLPLAFTCASGANDLYGILVTRDAITGESAGDDITINLTIEQTYLGEDLTGDVKSIHFNRGKSDELGKAEVGQLSLTLNNDSGNYSPSYSSGDYYGYLKPKRVVGIRAYDDDYNYQLFYGFIEEIIPHPHKTEQDAIITASDGIDYLSRHDMATALYKDVKTGIIHDYILTDANWLRLARLDDGQDTVPYWYGHGVKSRTAQEEIDDNEQGFSYVDGFGYFNFEDRHHRSIAEHQTSQATFDNTMSNIFYSLNPKNVYNIIRATVTPWELQSSTTLWTLEEIPSIPIGESKTWWADASINGESVFVDAWTTLVASTDYTANSQSDGGGSDMTSDIAVTLNKLAKTLKITLTNNGTSITYITLLQARGTYYDDKTKVTLKAEDTTSQDNYQKRTFKLDGKYMADTDKAQDYVNYAIGKYKNPRAEISMSIMNQDDTVLAQILGLEISDRITVVNDNLGLNSDYFVDYMGHDISMGGKLHTVTYRLADCINEDFWALGYSALASSTESGQTKLGY
uniref:Putative tail protein n=1 Tax=viral metagenome TaxID=1070528 RepID=A0A6M3IQ23_9ZZZZ